MYYKGFKCTRCESGCYECNESNCLQCGAATFKLGPKCVTVCPDGFELAPDMTECIVKIPIPIPIPEDNNTTIPEDNNTTIPEDNTNTTTNTTTPNTTIPTTTPVVPAVVPTTTAPATTALITYNLEDNKYVPVPYTILFIFFGLVVIASKMHKMEVTFIIIVYSDFHSWIDGWLDCLY